MSFIGCVFSVIPIIRCIYAICIYAEEVWTLNEETIQKVQKLEAFIYIGMYFR